MSKIGAVRLINVNYNNNAIRISDETFHFHGESTLLSLRNGGGKSVLVQMMTAPFVHKRYRDAKDRPFESYFTTNKPSFILVEWVLDQGAGCVLTGMMVRRSQDSETDSSETLDLLTFVSEYREPCLQDIHHLPVVEKGAKEMVLKSFASCRQMFDMWKKDSSLRFFCYDCTNPAQSRQYFDKLMEYQINYKEWESIIKKVNLKESGLSELFSDCRDEKGLVEKWFLDAVEDKLNRERNRMKEFQNLLEKYVAQYQDNQSKIRRRDAIRLFREEAAPIREQAERYQEEEEKEKEQMHLLARFIGELNCLKQAAADEQQTVLGKMDEILLQIARIEYEKLSGEFYGLEEKLRYHMSNRDMIEAEQDALRREAEEIEQRLHLLACARQQEYVDEIRAELLEIRQRIQVSRQEEAELRPERDRIGRTLYGHYGRVFAENEDNLRKNREQYEELTTQAAEEKKKLAGYEQSLREEASRQGALKSKVESYDRQEEQYNQAYGEQLARNILGEYEPGTLDIRKKTLEKEMEECVRSRQRKKKQQETGLERQKSLERTLQELHTEQARKGVQKEHEERLQEEYQKELDARKIVLQYLGLPGEMLFETDGILQASGRKLKELDGLLQNMHQEERQLKKEHRQLTEGRTLELPEALEAEFLELGIPMVYGMEWLQKNGYTEEENRKLVHSHPFLPYALILSRKELDRLSKHTGEVCTSFPVPIVVREELEEKPAEKAGGILDLSGVHFYLLFNENLLNEEKLRLLVEEKEQEIRKKQGAIELRKKEYDEYYGRQELVRNQSVNKERYEENERCLQELSAELTELEEQIRSGREEEQRLLQDLKALEKELEESKEELNRLQRRKTDLEQLCRDYEQYEQDRQELERCKRAIRRLEERKALAESSLEKLSGRQKTLDLEANRLEEKCRRLKEKQQIYEKYAEDGVTGDGQQIPPDRAAGQGEEPPSALDAADIELMEARYLAITGSMSQKLQDMEAQESRTAKKYDSAAGDLEHLRLRYRLEPEAWKNIPYNAKEELHQESLLEDCRRKQERKQGLLTEEVKYIAAAEQQKKDCIRRMQEACGKEEPLPKQEIQDQDFESRKKELEYQKKELRRQEEKLKERLQGYEENLTALSAYSDFPLGEPVAWEQEISEMDRQELRDFQGIRLRDYRQSTVLRQQARSRLFEVLNRVVRMDAFQEDFYRKPLEAMLELTDEAGQVLRQLSTTLQSYESLMEKLEVDISLVEKEKEKIVELLEDYVREVHQNMDRIDANSTITIRERPVKMLKIQLPQWEENENLYRLKLQDMIDEVTKKGLQILSQNGNAQEYFGTQLTTKNLYDAVIGISNVQIRLYKIEAQREYPITWAEVAKNSGGEGFLSAFVILTSLLYYMRKDETDIFADRNEGKVLLMDNPFAQTNAAHLLKPLMEVAKKTNTQLICLTGLGGESIYSRFDNIYVLNLIAARLRGGMQYLRAEHLRGNEPETMVVSQIEVMEQQELIF